MRTLTVEVSNERITKQVAKHFRDPEAMAAFFGSIYKSPPAPSTLDDDDELGRLMKMPAAAILFADVMTICKFLDGLRRRPSTDEGWVTFRMGEAEARRLRHALLSLVKLNGTPEGPAILDSLVWLLPKEAKPREILRDIRKFLAHDGFEEFRWAIESYLATDGAD